MSATATTWDRLDEQRARHQRGDWGEAIEMPGFARGEALTEVRRSVIYGPYMAMLCEEPVEGGVVPHAIVIRTGQHHPLCIEGDLRRVAAELLGAEGTLLIVPAMEDTIEADETHHLWLVPDGLRLPFDPAAWPARTPRAVG